MAVSDSKKDVPRVGPGVISASHEGNDRILSAPSINRGRVALYVAMRTVQGIKECRNVYTTRAYVHNVAGSCLQGDRNSLGYHESRTRFG